MSAEFQLMTAPVLVSRLTGFGSQFNQHTFASITGASAQSLLDLEERVRQLRPQFVRLFFNPQQEQPQPVDAPPDAGGVRGENWRSLVRAAKLAQDCGAELNITWQSGPWDTAAQRQLSMRGFAAALASLVNEHGLTNLRWATIQNEPNTTRIAWSDKRLAEWRAFKKQHPKAKPPKGTADPDGIFDFSRYEDLHRQLAKQLGGLSGQIKLMAGDLTQDNQELWFDHFARSQTLASLVHAYSVHIYWNYWDTAKINSRLIRVRGLAGKLDQPLFVTEYGVRGKRRKANLVDPGVFEDGSEDGSPVAQSPVAGFQYAWFNILAARHGYSGTAHWDCFQGKYDGGTLSYYSIGPHQDQQQPAERWHAFPSYHLLRLLTTTIDPHWQALTMHPLNTDASTKLLAGFAKNTALNDLAIIGLDTRGKLADDPTSETYTISGLPHAKSLTPLIWNQDGKGSLTSANPINTGAAGTATLTLPRRAVFALTTKPAPL